MSYRLHTAALSAQPQRFPGAYDDDPHGGKQAVGGPPPPTRFFKCVLCVVFLVLLLIIITIIVLVIIYKPRNPQVIASYLTVSNLTLADTTISGIFGFRFAVINPNHAIKIRYKRLNASVYFKSGFIGSTKLDDFLQGTKQSYETPEAKITVDSAQLTARKINDINWERQNRGFVYFNLELKADFWQLVPLVQGEKMSLTARCEGMEVVLGPDTNNGATREGGYKSCKIQTS